MPGIRPITDVAADLGVPADRLAAFGTRKAKLDHTLATGERRTGSRYVLVTGVTPTPAGEGKTVQTIGLAMALARLGGGSRAVCTLRQPSLGPVFGMKGGGTGGGASTLHPSDDINLHLLGDAHAVAAANNLLAAAIDTSITLENPYRIDPEAVSWKRVVDINDRALRSIRTGLGGPKNGLPRDSGFDITPASEVMSILGLAADLDDLRARLDRTVIGRTLSSEPITAGDLGVSGAMTALLRDAIDPNLVQTCEGTPALVHTGPFANISFGNSSVLADRIALRYADWVVTEAGFGADMGAEKFFNIKCRATGLEPDVAVLVATVRSLKAQSGKFERGQGVAFLETLVKPDLEALAIGINNLEAQIDNVRLHGIPVVVAINHFGSDAAEELELIRERALAAGASRVAVSDVFALGGAGGRELAEAVAEVAESGTASLKRLYRDADGLREKVWAIATQVYGAESVRFSPRALEEIWRLEESGFGGLPVCIAKTQYSLSHDPTRLGRPRGFDLPVREMRLCAGAGFVVPMVGEIMTMPGMGRNPSYRRIDVGPDGEIRGLA
jgi:formate--tetrahydrofolate ligase